MNTWEIVYWALLGVVALLFAAIVRTFIQIRAVRSDVEHRIAARDTTHPAKETT